MVWLSASSGAIEAERRQGETQNLVCFGEGGGGYGMGGGQSLPHSDSL